MRAKDHPAARPPQQPVFRGEDDEPAVGAPVFDVKTEAKLFVEETAATPLIDPETNQLEPEVMPYTDSALRSEEESPHGSGLDPDNDQPPSLEAGAPPDPTWEPIATAPHDTGIDMWVRWGLEPDAVTRVVRWKMGRRFIRPQGRWVPGGRWMPTDSMEPLPADDPTHWLRQPTVEEPVSDEAA